MKSLLLFAIFIFSGFLGSAIFASSISIIVSDVTPNCTKPNAPEQTQYILSSEETIDALENYFTGNRNKYFYDAAIVNAKIKFCSDSEKRKVFSAIVQNFNQQKVSKKTFEVMANYYQSLLMKQLIQDVIDSDNSSAVFKNNLVKAKKTSEKAWAKRSK